MANPNQFMGQFRAQVTQLITTLQTLETQQDMLAQDATLAAAAAAAGSVQGQPPLTATDINNAASAVNQLLFAFNSGDPPQKSFLYKIQ